MRTNARRRTPSATYNDGTPYRPARGRHAPRQPVEYRRDDLKAVVNLSDPKMTSALFIQLVVREMRLRFYQPKTIKAYKNALRGFLRCYRYPLDEVMTEDVRRYLEILVNAGASSSWVSVNLSALRTAFDKMCGLRCTLGLMTPRRPKRLPVVLSAREIERLLEAAPSYRDKLLLGLMYATGLRVSEVVRLRWQDIDFDRRTIRIWQGKGRTDRDVMLPNSFEKMLRYLAQAHADEPFLFMGAKRNRHLSPRSAQRAMERAVKLAGIRKRATCHSLRHSFATHLFEHGTDIRHIQKFLGHLKLETTTIYTKVARRSAGQVDSPLDRMQREKRAIPKAPSVGKLKIELEPLRNQASPGANVNLTIDRQPDPVRLNGIVVKEPRPGWLSLELPPLELWEEPLKRLTVAQRQRVESPEFYELLQREVTRRYLARSRSPG